MNATRQTLTVWRRDPLRITLAVTGYDLSQTAPAFAVRLYPDAPGAPLLVPSVHIVAVLHDADGVATTLIELTAPKYSMIALPPAAEIGSDLALAYDLQWTPPEDGSGFTAVEETVLFGDFIVKGSVNG